MSVERCKNWTLIAGGTMLFSHEALQRLADPWMLHACVDDLLILRAEDAYPYEGILFKINFQK